MLALAESGLKSASLVLVPPMSPTRRSAFELDLAVEEDLVVFDVDAEQLFKK